MRVKRILSQLLATCVGKTHKGRLHAVTATVEALLQVQRLNLTDIGRGLPGTPKHGIKRVDRLLSNPRLQGELIVFYGAIARLLLSEKQRPVVLIDWTQAADGLEALVAALPCGGRAIPILARVVPTSRYGNPQVQRRFLRDLKHLLPAQCRPIIVADAGFRSPFMEQVSEVLGWDFIIRLRGRCVAYSFKTHKFIPHAQLRRKAGPKPKTLGQWFPYGSRGTGHRVDANLVVGPRRYAKRGIRNYQQRKAEEPWLLATSLYGTDPDKIVAFYALRMRIEEAFRDAKSHRFGWALRSSLTSNAPRMEVLLMFAALAMVATHIVGTAADQLGLARKLQANTRKQRVLSIFSIGRHFIRRPRGVGRLALGAALRSIRKAIRAWGLAWRPGWLDLQDDFRWLGV